MDAGTWREKIRNWFRDKAQFIRREAPANVYGVLCASTLMPLIAAIGQGQLDTILTLSTVMGGIGTGVIANRITAWMNRSEEEIGADLQVEVQKDPELRAALDALFLNLEVPQIAHDALSELRIESGLAERCGKSLRNWAIGIGMRLS